jgi:hypothetical protein
MILAALAPLLLIESERLDDLIERVSELHDCVAPVRSPKGAAAPSESP